VRESTVDVAIIGAGPYGLSLAAHLRAQGIEFRVFGKPMLTWRQMPGGMFLKSESASASLSAPTRSSTLPEYCDAHGIDYTAPVSMGDFVAYGMWFQQRNIPCVDEIDVVDVRQDGQQFALSLAKGEIIQARRVLVAAGINYFAASPDFLERLPPTLASHTSQHADLSGFAGRDVTVIGGGQSSLQTAALLHEQDAIVRVLVRKPYVIWNPPPQRGPVPLRTRIRYPDSGLGPGWRNWLFQHVPVGIHALPEETRCWIVRESLGPAGAWWLRDRVDGKVPVLTGCTIDSAEPEAGGVALCYRDGNGEKCVHTDHVIAGTGFRVNVDRLPFLCPDIRGRIRRVAGAPALTMNLESSVAGLYFAGVASANSFGPMFRFVLGADFTARRISSHLRKKVASLMLPGQMRVNEVGSAVAVSSVEAVSAESAPKR
jgi:hypothetical protein